LRAWDANHGRLVQCCSLQMLGGVLLLRSPSIHVHLALLLELILHHHLLLLLLLLLLSRVLMSHGIVRAPSRIMQGAARVLPRHISVLHRRRARAWAAAVRGPTSPLRW